jgi:hypothetical protein
MHKQKQWLSNIALGLMLLLALPTLSSASDLPALPEGVIELSAFGERANFSPDGKRVVFVGKNHGDAFEIEIATRKIRNLTNNIPHQGIHRIQYLPNGDFLITASRLFVGPQTRANMEMWVLDKSLKLGLQPLNEKPLEGIAVSRKENLISWTAVEPEVELDKGQPWQILFSKPTKRYVAEIGYVDGAAQIINKREIMAELPKECNFAEPQDFRHNDKELVFSCLSYANGMQVSVMGYTLVNGQYTTYRSRQDEYNEIEGVAPSGEWGAVECGEQTAPGIPPLDMCKLELKPNGKMQRLLPHIAKDALGEFSNPVISPDGQWAVFQKSAATDTEYGVGQGLFMARLPD